MRVQIDVGFGDAVTPAAQAIDFPPLLDFPAPRLRAPEDTVSRAPWASDTSTKVPAAAGTPSTCALLNSTKRADDAVALAAGLLLASTRVRSTVKLSRSVPAVHRGGDSTHMIALSIEGGATP